MTGTQRAPTAMINWEGTFLLVKKKKKNHLTDFSVSDTAILCFFNGFMTTPFVAMGDYSFSITDTGLK